MISESQRPEWTQAWAAWARQQSRQLDWEHRIEMRRRILVRAATNGDKRLREALYALVGVAHGVGQEMRQRNADASGLADHDVELLATRVLEVVGAIPTPHGVSDDDMPF